jgi:hypothetical protein
MSDITEAPTQDAIAESLLPEEPQTATDITGTETDQQVEEFSPENAEQVEAQPDETAEEWLPSDQDKVFTDDVLLRYAERYQKDQQWLSDPLNRQLLVDKLNSDIYFRQQQEQATYQEPEQEAEPEPVQTQQPQFTREQWFSNLSRAVEQRTDPEVAKQFHAEFLKSFGVPDAEIAKMPPQQALQFTQTASKYMLNLMHTFMGDILQATLPQQLSQVFPGFDAMYDRSSHAMAWDRVRNSDAAYSNLPAYGTKEFSSTLRQAAARIPGFDEMQFTDRNGQPLPAMENAMRKYGMLAQIAAGRNVDPALLQRAAAAGAQNARRAAVRRSAGNLGSGQSKAGSASQTSSKFQTNSDLFDDDTMDLYAREHGRL